MEPFPNWKLNFSICLHDFVFTAVLRGSWSNKHAAEQIPQTRKGGKKTKREIEQIPWETT